jgi:hypothetical protein
VGEAVSDVAVDVAQLAAERSERAYGEAGAAPALGIGAQPQLDGDGVGARLGAVDDERGVGRGGAEAEAAPRREMACAC